MLVRNYPEKTGVEILAIVEQEKLEYKRKEEELHKKELEFIEDINTNGGYYKGTFGLDQYYYDRFFNLRLEQNVIICDVENIVIFYNEDSVSCEKRIKEYEMIENYGINVLNTKITKEEFDKVSQQIDNIVLDNFELINLNS